MDISWIKKDMQTCISGRHSSKIHMLYHKVIRVSKLLRPEKNFKSQNLIIENNIGMDSACEFLLYLPW